VDDSGHRLLSIHAEPWGYVIRCECGWWDSAEQPATARALWTRHADSGESSSDSAAHDPSSRATEDDGAHLLEWVQRRLERLVAARAQGLWSDADESHYRALAELERRLLRQRTEPENDG